MRKNSAFLTIQIGQGYQIFGFIHQIIEGVLASRLFLSVVNNNVDMPLRNKQNYSTKPITT